MRSYEITVYRGSEVLFTCKVPTGQISDGGLGQLVQALVAKHGLDDAEIVDSYLRKRAEAYMPYLEVHRDNRAGQLMCGGDPNAVVRVVEG